MKGQYSSKSRKKLRLKIATVLGENMKMLSSGLRETLLDDLITAFENRVKVFRKIQSNVPIEVAGSVDYETVQA